LGVLNSGGVFVSPYVGCFFGPRDCQGATKIGPLPPTLDLDVIPVAKFFFVAFLFGPFYKIAWDSEFYFPPNDPLFSGSVWWLLRGLRQNPIFVTPLLIFTGSICIFISTTCCVATPFFFFTPFIFFPFFLPVFGVLLFFSSPCWEFG